MTNNLEGSQTGHREGGARFSFDVGSGTGGVGVGYGRGPVGGGSGTWVGSW